MSETLWTIYETLYARTYINNKRDELSPFIIIAPYQCIFQVIYKLFPFVISGNDWSFCSSFMLKVKKYVLSFANFDSKAKWSAYKFLYLYVYIYVFNNLDGTRQYLITVGVNTRASGHFIKVAYLRRRSEWI